MNSFLRVGLPILVVVGFVFGITFIRMYTSSDDNSPEAGAIDASGKPLVFTPAALKFHTVKASLPPPDVLAAPKGARFLHLKYWDPELEIGAPAGYGYWAQNEHSQEVRLRANSVGCQCTGLSAAPIPPDVYRDYLQTSALAGSPLCPAAGPITALAHAVLMSKLEWTTLLKDGHGEGITIPPADPKTGPQQLIVRMFWTGKEPVGPKNNIYASLYAGLPGAVETKADLSADVVVVQSFDLVRRDLGDWAQVMELKVGELRRNAVGRQSFYCFTSTRPSLVLSAELETPDPCITVSTPTLVSEQEVRELEAFMTSKTKAHRAIKAMYRIDVTVRERLETETDGKRETKFLDLGTLDRKLILKAVEAGTVAIPLRGLTVGEVAILSGTIEGRIELGNSFSASQDRSVDVILAGEKPDVDLALIAAETSSKILKVELTPLPVVGGKKQWRLRVTVPKGTLYSAVPDGTAVVLTTGGPSPRKLRLPVRGAAFDSGPAL